MSYRPFERVVDPDNDSTGEPLAFQHDILYGQVWYQFIGPGETEISIIRYPNQEPQFEMHSTARALSSWTHHVLIADLQTAHLL